jgi:hypothetical protein
MNKGIKALDTETLILIDGTRFMEGMINLLIDSLDSIISAAKTNKKGKNSKNGDLKIQIAIYRDYDCEDDILETSGWKNNSIELIQFLENVRVFGGDDYPGAVEIGLQFANKLSFSIGLSQIILIADASPKELDSVIRDRKKYKWEEFWLETYGPPTVWHEEIKLLKGKKIPIHAIYLENEDSARVNKKTRVAIEDARLLERKFKKISEETKGESIYLNLQQPEAKEKIIQKLTALIY